MTMSNGCYGIYIYNIRVRIAKSLDENRLSIILNSLFKVVHIFRINKGNTYTIRSKCVCKKIVRAPINGLCRHYMVATTQDVQQSIVDCCCSGCYCKTGNTTFKSGNTIFKDTLCGVCQTTINISGITKTKTVCCMLRIIKHIRCRLIYWDCSCTCCNISCFLPHVNLKRFKMKFFFCHNISSLFYYYFVS